MRILYLNTGAQMGGAETSLIELLAAVREANPTWDLRLLVGEDGPLVRKAESLGVRADVLTLPPGFGGIGDAGERSKASLMFALFRTAPEIVSYGRKMAHRLGLTRPDLVHATGFKMQALAAQCRAWPAPLVWHIHDYVSARPIMRRALAYYARRCSAVVVNSRSVAADVRTVLGDARPIFTLYNAVDLNKFAPDGPVIDLDAASGLEQPPSGTVRVGFVGTFARWKGHEVFLNALSLLPRELGVRGYIIGGPIYQTAGSQYTFEYLRGTARRLGLEGVVGFTGFVAEAAQAIRALDIVVHASTRPEPFGMVIVEAMACGKPVISSGSGGAGELIIPCHNALAHRPGDHASLAECIMRLARDPELRSRIARAGREAAERCFDRSRLRSELIPLYHSVIAEANSGIPGQRTPVLR